jgi:hypothetical protein
VGAINITPTGGNKLSIVRQAVGLGIFGFTVVLPEKKEKNILFHPLATINHRKKQPKQVSTQLRAVQMHV